MSTKRLAALAALSDQQTQRQLLELRASEQELLTLDKQRRDLDGFARDYQRAPVGHDGIQPGLLAHRREFVDLLQEQLHKLRQRVLQHRETVDVHSHRYQKKAAQTAALNAMHAQSVATDGLRFARVEQRQQDELSLRNHGRGTNNSGHHHSVATGKDD